MAQECAHHLDMILLLLLRRYVDHVLITAPVVDFLMAGSHHIQHDDYLSILEADLHNLGRARSLQVTLILHRRYIACSSRAQLLQLGKDVCKLLTVFILVLLFEASEKVLLSHD